MAAPLGFVDDEKVVTLTDAMFSEGVAELRSQLRDHILAGVRVLIVDVSRVDRLSSSAVAALLGAHRMCRARGGHVVLRHPSHRTSELLRNTGLHRVFHVEGGRI